MLAFETHKMHCPYKVIYFVASRMLYCAGLQNQRQGSSGSKRIEDDADIGATLYS